MSSLYGQYIAELEGKHIIENEHGFLTYSIEGDVIYIEHLFVKPEHRRTRLATEMADFAVELAKRQGCKRLLGSVDANAKDKHQSVLNLIYYGMTFHTVVGSMVYFIKDI
jgi:GNAT superfamily N-acetyltransferase